MLIHSSPAAPSGKVPHPFQPLLQRLQSKQWSEVQALAAPLFADPDAAGAARALWALAAAMAGDADGARAALAQVPDADALDDTEALVAAGSAWFRLNNAGQAVHYLSQAVRRDEDHALARARLGACLLATGHLAAALPHLERAAQLLPQVPGVWVNLARARLTQGQPQAALDALDTAAALPGMPAAEPVLYPVTRAQALAQLGRYEEAESQLRSTADSGVAPAWEALVNLQASRGEHDIAAMTLADALRRHPGDLALLMLGTDLAQVRGRHGEARHLLRLALERQPDASALWCRAAMMAAEHALHNAAALAEARAAAAKALELTASDAGAPRALAVAALAAVLAQEGDVDGAILRYREALDLHPACLAALNGLGHTLLEKGQVDEATALFRTLRDIAPLEGWSQLIRAREVPDDPQVLEQLAQAARRPSLEGPVRSHLLFTLATAWERKRDYDQAWAFVAEANAAVRPLLPYDPRAHRARVERIIARFSGAFMDSRQGWGHDSALPVFVLGMPRSGTTLVEQILGSHSAVFGAGELSLVPELAARLDAWEARLGSGRRYPECIAELGQAESRRYAEQHLAALRAHAPGAARIVDKLPHNFMHVGLIKLLFPNAKILRLKREPRDVAISNFFTNFGAKFGGMGFAYDLGWIGEQLVDHQRLMDHWHAVFPGQILEVDYDALVEDVEGWARRIVNYLELPWEDGVLAFQQLERSVKTASVWQVRQPVYTTSKAKWRRYATHLAPLEAALAQVPPMPAPAPIPALRPTLFVDGIGHLQAGRLPDAQECFRELLAANPEHAAALYFLGAALMQQGRLEEAGAAMRQALALGNAPPQWRAGLAAVEAAIEAQRLRAAGQGTSGQSPQ